MRCMRKGHGALECPVCLQVLSVLALLVHEYRYVSSGTNFTCFTSTKVRTLTHGVAPALQRSCDACGGRVQMHLLRRLLHQLGAVWRAVCQVQEGLAAGPLAVGAQC